MSTRVPSADEVRRKLNPAHATSDHAAERPCPDCDGEGEYRDDSGRLVDCEWCAGTGRLNALPTDDYTDRLTAQEAAEYAQPDHPSHD